MDDELTPEATAANNGGEAGSLEPDPNLVRLVDRAVAAGLKAAWGRFKNRTTGEFEGPFSLRIEIPPGRRVRRIHLDQDDAEALASFKFERWIALGDYQAILDADNRVIIAEVDARISFPTPFSRLPGVTANSSDETSPTLRRINRLTIQAPNGDLSLELYSYSPPEIAALEGRRALNRYGLAIHGVAATRHDDALELLLDLSNSFFIDLDIGYGLRASLVKAYDAELTAQNNYEFDPPNTVVPRFPSERHNRDAVALYLYARSLIQMPLQEYLAHYQVIEFYLPTYTRSETITRVRNMLKDPTFDYNNDLTLGRLLETVAPTGKKTISERGQVATTIACCVDDAAIAAFLEDRPAAAKALADKNRIRGVRVITAHDRQTKFQSSCGAHLRSSVQDRPRQGQR